MPLSLLRPLRDEAAGLRLALDRFLHLAEGRLNRPFAGAHSTKLPLGTDWSWRPELWSGPVSPPGIAGAGNRAMIGREATVFHDCRESELTLRQLRNHEAGDQAGYGLRMDVFRFDGSFLSVVLDLPEQAARGLRRNHVLRLDMRLDLERPLEIFARLNIRHGPNTDQLVRELPLDGKAGVHEACVEFDLAYSKMNEKRLEKAWIDLIFEGPQMNRVTLRDMMLSRHPRAEL
ncbi:hypothetical protein SAMN05878426_102463 [Phaeovulum vinaykumarii]|uniref:Uncharacterized protein n=2 Tax=Phaeovulum vinaykumarii TaxID=407234 RepID=A0A1N7KYB5_9RHOB|nr:hypothetical protein SAMN05421795_102309 [Phaeovulum vinaykumarii]SOC01034.1 hypothetical protein SAMN05878426_102463 [Phaeovulum vinaykumarii]